MQFRSLERSSERNCFGRIELARLGWMAEKKQLEKAVVSRSRRQRRRRQGDWETGKSRGERESARVKMNAKCE